MNFNLTPDLYSKQTLFVESFLEFHPEAHPDQNDAFSPEERTVFTKVFQPDWDSYNDDYQQTFRALFDTNPELLQQSQALLKKFCQLTGTASSGILREE